MGILSGSDNSGQKNQRKENRRAQQYVEGQLGYAIDDVNRGYDFGDQYRTDTFNNALNLIGGGTYGEMDYYNRGNVAAQQNLINSMPQYQNALFGMPVDYSRFMAKDLGMPNRPEFNAQLPNPNSYPGYGGVNYSGEPYTPESSSYGPWQAMAYGTPPYVEEQRSMADRFKSFGDGLAGRGNLGMSKAAIMQLLGG